MQDLIERIITWAGTQDAVRAVVLTGSLTRANTPKTRFSDVDVELILTDVAQYTESEAWLNAIGEVWLCFPLENGDDEPTRLVWFAGGKKIDFTLASVDKLQQMADAHRLSDYYELGYQLLVDKDGWAEKLPLPSYPPPTVQKPTAQQFDFVVKEFWFEATHVSQYIHAREMWVVKFRDWTMKSDLLQMMEWHTGTQHNWVVNTRHIGKGIAGWLDPEFLKSLHGIWGEFDAASSWRALLALLPLFRRLATETAAVLGYEYPADVDAKITAYIESLYAEDDLKG